MSDIEKSVKCCGNALDIFKLDLKYKARRNWIKIKKLKPIMFDVDR